MSVEIRIPEVGESITEGILAGWEKPDGAFVKIDDPLFVLETDKVTMTINSEQSGQLEILVGEGETVQVGQVVAKLDPSAASEPEAGRPEAADSPAREVQSVEVPAPQVKTAAAAEAGRAESRPARNEQLSPAVRRLVAEHDLDPEQIEGTGRGGRITKEDVLRHLSGEAQPRGDETGEKPAQPLEAAAASGPRPVAPLQTPPQPTQSAQRQTRTKMTPLRKRIAERLVQAQQTAAILTTFNEVDMTNVMEWRARYKETFKERYGIGLGFMSFFIKASVDALRAIPAVNAQIDGDEIVQNHFFDIGVAVGTDRGLVVPIVRNADQLSFAEVELAVADLAGRAQEKKLTLDELTGGCFTVSNGGVYGSLLSTPIVNPPQSGILGMHGIKKRPVAMGDQIQIRPMMYLALSYDHRLVDGRESVTFLKRIVECIENPERMLLEI